MRFECGWYSVAHRPTGCLPQVPNSSKRLHGSLIAIREVFVNASGTGSTTKRRTSLTGILLEVMDFQLRT